MYTRNPLAQTHTRPFALGDNSTHKINSTILKYAIRIGFIIVFLKIVELVISIKRIKITFCFRTPQLYDFHENATKTEAKTHISKS